MLTIIDITNKCVNSTQVRGLRNKITVLKAPLNIVIDGNNITITTPKVLLIDSNSNQYTYSVKNYLTSYMNYFNIKLLITLNHPNIIDFDLNFINYHIRAMKNNSIIFKYDNGESHNYVSCDNSHKSYICNKNKTQNEFIKNNIHNGLIFHPKQLYNIYDSLKIYNIEGNIYINQNGDISPLDIFLDKTYQMTFDEIVNIIFKKYCENINNLNDELLIISFIGNIERGYEITHHLSNYKKKTTFFSIFILSKKIINNTKFIENIKKNFNNYIIYQSNEFGNDITPSLLAYNDFITKYKCDFKYIIKLHTKTNNLFFQLTQFLLDKTPLELLKLKTNKCNVVANPANYIQIKNDRFNKELYNIHKNIIIKDTFAGGSIFFSEKIYFDAVYNFFMAHNRLIIFNNVYDPNYINRDHSYIHFIERLFGTVKAL